jgi:hypothetical protein
VPLAVAVELGDGESDDVGDGVGELDGVVLLVGVPVLVGVPLGVGDALIVIVDVPVAV